MLKKLGLIVGILIAAVILIAAGVMIGKFGLNPTPTAITQTPASQSANPTPTTTIPAVPTSTTSTSTPNPTSTAIPNNSDKVDFTLQITSVKETGTLSRSITGEISNIGSIAAHNVIAMIEVYSNGKLIKVNNGQSAINKTLGTIEAGQTMTTTVDLSFGPIDGLTLLQNGATVNLQISSDEKTQKLSYDYKP